VHARQGRHSDFFDRVRQAASGSSDPFSALARGRSPIPTAHTKFTAGRIGPSHAELEVSVHTPAGFGVVLPDLVRIPSREAAEGPPARGREGASGRVRHEPAPSWVVGPGIGNP